MMNKPPLILKVQAEEEIRKEHKPDASDAEWNAGRYVYYPRIEERAFRIMEQNNIKFLEELRDSQYELIEKLHAENMKLKKELEAIRKPAPSESFMCEFHPEWLRPCPICYSHYEESKRIKKEVDKVLAETICNTHQHLKPCPQCELVNQVEERGKSVGDGKGYVPAGSIKVKEEPARLDCGNPTCLRCNPKEGFWELMEKLVEAHNKKEDQKKIEMYPTLDCGNPDCILCHPKRLS